jgi:hypothetical protein
MTEPADLDLLALVAELAPEGTSTDLDSAVRAFVDAEHAAGRPAVFAGIPTWYQLRDPLERLKSAGLLHIGFGAGSPDALDQLNAFVKQVELQVTPDGHRVLAPANPA